MEEYEDNNRHAHPVDRVEVELKAEYSETNTVSPSQDIVKASGHSYQPPTKGWPAVQYGMQQRMQKISKGYKPIELTPNKAERFERQLVRIDVKKDLLRQLTITNQRIVTVANSKGGASKTPDMGYLSCIQMDITRDPVLFIDANINAGSAHALFGFNREETILLRQAVAGRHELNSYSTLAGVTARHPSGTRFIGSDVDGDEDGAFTLSEFNETIRINDGAFHSTYLDNGNGFSDIPNIGCIESANAVVFSALADKPSSLEGLVTTMDRYIDLQFEQKVYNGFVVINATQPGDTKQMYVDKLAACMKKQPSRLVTRNGVTETVERDLSELKLTMDRIFMIPFSQHIRDDKVISTDPAVIGYDTYEAFLDILIAMFERNTKYSVRNLRHIASSDVQSTQQFVTSS